MVSYALELFKANSALYKLANECNNSGLGTDKYALDGGEIALFQQKINEAGIDFEFGWLDEENATAYLDSIGNNYQRNLDNKKLQRSLSDKYGFENYEDNNVKMLKITIKKDKTTKAQLCDDLKIPATEVKGDKFNAGDVVCIKAGAVNTEGFAASLRNYYNLFKGIISYLF
ncbi:MAG: hypothetical protein E7Z89_02430 [Cyanobacteria bacterium SIG28]|nr:hypothetical protein [Cyanobacteria bacterium SIG28]